jgi:hypothetical protein
MNVRTGGWGGKNRDWRVNDRETRDTDDDERDQNVIMNVGLKVEDADKSKNISKRTSEFSLAMRSKIVLYVLSS